MGIQLSFKFTKGSIKLNMSKLDHFESNYRKAIMLSPSTSSPSLSEAEIQVIHDAVLRPTIHDFKAFTSGSPPQGLTFVDKAWNQSKQPIPAMATSDESSIRSRLWDVYWFLVTTTSSTSHEAMRDLLLKHPYLFWRPPVDLYKESIIQAQRGGVDLDAILRIFEENDFQWSDGVRGASNVHEVLVAKATPEVRKSLYDAHRLIIAGQSNISSPSVDWLSRLLGKDETLHRLGVVRGLLTMLGAGQ